MNELKINNLHEFGLACLALPQVNMELQHLFTDKAYCRMLIMPANTVVMSAVHKTKHVTVCCYGVADVVDADGNKTRITGPSMWVTEPGTQRALHIIEESCWVGFFVGEFDSVLDAEQQLIDDPSFFGVIAP